MKQTRILWADDEIDILRPHILFLEQKGYNVTPVNSGIDAIESFENDFFDIVFLDEHMPGLSGLETLRAIKDLNSNIPVIMITKSEDEGIMTDAIGKKITDYLIKPVNPHQILLALKKHLHQKDIVSEATLESFREEYKLISNSISFANTPHEWVEIYKKLIHWDFDLNESQNELHELLLIQKQEANVLFSKFVKNNYESWIENKENRPLISPEIFSKHVFPLIDNQESVYFILIDNFRLDQWDEVKALLAPHFNMAEDTFFSILPTATQYARNAMFAGMMPNEIIKHYPNLWIGDQEQGSKNQHEELLLQSQIDRFRKKYTFSYNKILSSAAGEKWVQHIDSLKSIQLNVLVINFVDMLSHARTESKMIRELAADEAAYRSLTRSWFKHSGTLDLIKRIGETGAKIILTTDHGTIRVKNPIKVLGDKELNTNMRYKLGKNLEYERKKVYDIRTPQNIGLPAPNLSTKYIFACGDDFFVYPNNYNHYVSYYTDTFQHGGISMEEMIVPLITLTPKNR